MHKTIEPSPCVLNADETKAFFENKSINNAISSDGALENETYTRFARYDVNSEQGKNMLNSAIYIFVNPGTYGLLESDKDDGKDGAWQCDAVTRHILEIGGIYTFGTPVPNISYNSTDPYRDTIETVNNIWDEIKGVNRKIKEWID